MSQLSSIYSAIIPPSDDSNGAANNKPNKPSESKKPQQQPQPKPKKTAEAEKDTKPHTLEEAVKKV